MYKYETHLHTYPVSKCARVGVREVLEFYKKMGYDGVFVTNHFLDGNINIDPSVSYGERIDFYCSDYETAKELSYKGTDFLVYGLDKEWFLKNPQIMEMSKRKELEFMIENGALVIQAHPYREAGYIDHIRLFPRSVHGVEVINACRSELENSMAEHLANAYELIHFAGTDNHIGANMKLLAGMCSKRPMVDEADFITSVKNGEMEVFTLKNE